MERDLLHQTNSIINSLIYVCKLTGLAEKDLLYHSCIHGFFSM